MRPESSGKASLSHFCSASERSDGRFSVAGRIISALAHSAVSPLSGLALSRNKDQRTYLPDLRGKTIRPLLPTDRDETPERTESHIPARRARLAGAPARNVVRRTKKRRCYENRSIAEIAYSALEGPSIARSASRLRRFRLSRAYLAWAARSDGSFITMFLSTRMATLLSTSTRT